MSIKLDNLSFFYEDKRILNDLSFYSDSKILGLLGPNGSGKTTLVKLISGLLKYKSGDIYINDMNMNILSTKELAKIIAFVSQDYEPTYGFNVQEIIEMGRYPYLGRLGFINKKDKIIINEVIDLLSLNDLIKINVDDLSSGEKQKVRFARALVQQPKYLILDEPTSNLDLSNKILVIDVLKKISSFGTKIVLTSHDLSFIKESSDECILIKNGTILTFGETKKLINKDNIEKLYNLSQIPEWAY
ncbi:MAG: ABC transporter ATP-binding protein [Dehalococcoidia bacterium]|jgi:iron complex transport system ATP-binding protein|nr:MAG: ABC transporter ATP-binding protein [Chloroflexota bacterium]|tara:strand:+ start:1022 stop:1756 length:735 start_codon:yes stop_codon:yes gene_type:complete